MTPITTLTGRTFLGSATGFFYQSSDRHFLITNRHVVINEEESFFPETLRFIIHTSEITMTQVRSVVIPLYTQEKKHVWLEHPQKGVDLVALAVDPFLSQNDAVYYWSTANSFPSDSFLIMGDHLQILGYPKGFYDRANNLPIARSGTVASAYGSHFDANPLFLVDANLHPGTSGAPVLSQPRSTLNKTNGSVALGQFPSFLLGVNSGEFLHLGLNASWYADLITQIV